VRLHKEIRLRSEKVKSGRTGGPFFYIYTEDFGKMDKKVALGSKEKITRKEFSDASEIRI